MQPELDLDSVREQFPALARREKGKPVAYFDGPAGSQTPARVIDAVAHYLAHTNANTHGAFASARESDAILAAARTAAADLFGTDDADAVVFGANMTTLTFALSRSLARTWEPGDEVLVTRLDHDANVTPWAMAAREVGVRVRRVEIDGDDCTLDTADLYEKLTDRTRLVAIGAASNAVGTLNPVAEISHLAHEVGAEVFVDAVHFAPHRSMDVVAWGCDYAVCSVYKFFGPHLGMLWGKRDRLSALTPYQVRPAADVLPDRWLTGTQNHEGIAGAVAAIEYLADLGRSAGAEGASRRAALVAAYDAIAAHERRLVSRLLEGLAALPSIRVWGIRDPARLDERAPTVSLTHARLSPAAIAEHLAGQGIFAWHGNHYALELIEALGLAPDGTLRIGLLHYNTAEEVERLLAALAELD